MSTSVQRADAPANSDCHAISPPPSDSAACARQQGIDTAALLNELIETTANARSTGDALEAVFAVLRERCGALAMAMETLTNGMNRMQPFGDINALVVEPKPDTLCLLTSPLAASSFSEGKLVVVAHKQTWSNAFGDDIAARHVVESTAKLLSLQLAREALTYRAEEAERNVERRISEVAAIYEIGQAIDQIETPRLFQLITEKAASLMDAQTCVLLVAGPEGEGLRVAARTGLTKGAAQRDQGIDIEIAGRVAKTEQPVRIVGSHLHAGGSGGQSGADISSAMIVPMKSPEGKMLGVLSIQRRRSAPDFDDIDMKVFSVFATQAALALTNKQMYDDLKRRANELTKISTLSRALISTLDLDGLLRHVVEDICQIVGFERCCLYLRDSNRPIYSPRAWRGYPDATLRNPVREGEGAVGMAAKTKQPIEFDALEKPVEESAEPTLGANQQENRTGREVQRVYRQRKGFARSLGVSSFVAMPLLDSKDRCLGVVVADKRGSRSPISAEQKSLLAAFVNQAGIALENARLYEAAQDNLQNIHRLNSETENVLQSIGACILSTDAHGIVIRWNRATETTLAISHEALRNARLTDVIGMIGLPQNESRLLLQLVQRTQESGERQQRFNWTLHPARRTPMTIDLHVSRLLDYHQERAGVVLTFEDVTKEVQMQAELDRMRRLADIGQLAAKMAHEVRNALSPIKGAAQIIRHEQRSAGSATEWPDMIVAEVDGLSRLTSEMLDFARPKSLDCKPLDVRDLLSNSLTALQSFMQEHGVSPRMSVEPDNVVITADPLLLGQVIRNIAMNAAQSMPEGGELAIDARYTEDGTGVLLHFRDHGVGIPSEEIDRVFQPFVTTRAKGSGLGLSIVQKIVSQHGGDIRVDSTVGKGTCFTIRLPVIPSEEGRDAALNTIPLITDQSVETFPDN